MLPRSLSLPDPPSRRPTVRDGQGRGRGAWPWGHHCEMAPGGLELPPDAHRGRSCHRAAASGTRSGRDPPPPPAAPGSRSFQSPARQSGPRAAARAGLPLHQPRSQAHWAALEDGRTRVSAGHSRTAIAWTPGGGGGSDAAGPSGRVGRGFFTLGQEKPRTWQGQRVPSRGQEGSGVGTGEAWELGGTGQS